jgi:glycosyltransferase involved in cell wall biosynthesis
MRVAIVHDYLTQFGGAERVLLALMELFPNAPVFTLVHDSTNIKLALSEKSLRKSWLQRIPGARRHHRYFPLLMPMAVERFDFSEYDLVLSATHSFGKGIITGPQTLHISYCFTPTRYLWDDCHRYVRDFSRLAVLRQFAPIGLSYLRLWDYYASQRVDYYLTLSRAVADRISKYYNREAEVIPPPVDVDRFTESRENDGYYLVVSRLVPYKRIDLAIKACEKSGKRLKVVGTGPEEEYLKAMAGDNTEFLGFLSDDDLPGLYAGARALLFPQEEDFGITPIEAAASGKPTIAFSAGGALETVKDGETGIFFNHQTVDSLVAAINRFETMHFDAGIVRMHAQEYGKEVFLSKIKDIVQDKWREHKKVNATRI